MSTRQTKIGILQTDGGGHEGSTRSDLHVRRTALVGCGDAKHDGLLPAREKYRSTYFGLKRDFAETLCARWWILSAKFGLLDPDRVIDDYDVAITDDDVDTAQWVEDVRTALSDVGWPETTEDGRDLVWELYVLAGSDYLEAADQDGNALRVQLPDVTPEYVTIRFPFADLAGIGYQNGWLAACRDSGCVVETANHG
ncbi:hypothetical protein PNP59_08320 [Halobacterium salinarum]|uniref:DUF6884 domain-containing protein n=1 Tax=Haloplanus salinus TaxID=1126245 RepID=A0A368N0U2_9EURY|nr:MULTISPECIES: DUF6884 domain-containing protein [Halobacteria]MDL0130942.1 hypothetical protein [Halobacterium salinarum]RCU43713.1 hypothetical protein DU504_17630 [Haloplanus salinus]